MQHCFTFYLLVEEMSENKKSIIKYDNKIYYLKDLGQYKT